MLFGHKLRDHLPNQFRSMRKEWSDIRNAKELSFSRKNDKLSATGRTLRKLQVGDPVSIQNQHGNRPRKWSSTGVVVEVHPNRQYGVMLDGSRRITLRNRKFLRKLNTEHRRTTQVNKYNLPTIPADPDTPEITCSTPNRRNDVQIAQLSPISPEISPTSMSPTGQHDTTSQHQSPTTQCDLPPAAPTECPPIRRSTRTTMKPNRLIEEI